MSETIFLISDSFGSKPRAGIAVINSVASMDPAHTFLSQPVRRKGGRRRKGDRGSGEYRSIMRDDNAMNDAKVC